ncbi:MAG: MotA/TolQ/ExbB proton channel family protein [Elusimicrobia bacterium]|nr:MotA/TolQ/ExbB proton channel family protein [Elusimicrobiota bacterium]
MENEKNTLTRPAGGVFKQLFVIMLIVFLIYDSEGLWGFKPFLYLAALVLVFGGTFFLTWTAYPLKEMFRPSGPEVLLHAAGCAAAMGALATVLGMILILSSIDDVSRVPRRMALALDGLFFGLLLSEVILAPMAARLAASGKPENKPPAQSGGRKRLFISLFSLGIVLFSMMTVLFALTSGL